MRASGRVCFLVVCAVAFLAAQDSSRPGFVTGPSSSGAQLLNKPLLPGTAVLNCESITTSSSGSALLSGSKQGGLAALGHDSQGVVMTDSKGNPQIALQQGLAQVSGGVTVVTPQASFQPQGNSQFSVVADQDHTYVMGKSGSTNVGSIQNPTTVQPGQAFEIDAPLPPPGGGGQCNGTLRMPSGTAQMKPVSLQVVQIAATKLEASTVTQTKDATQIGQNH